MASISRKGGFFFVVLWGFVVFLVVVWLCSCPCTPADKDRGLSSPTSCSVALALQPAWPEAKRLCGVGAPIAEDGALVASP